ncbi:MAG: endonuclease/exonuclease/phosphatase family protein [Dehalococcoidia bacterium]|nr:endonuclease/exonuclease/phosphatase family protein [Dehalococcoidia bacterium]
MRLRIATFNIRNVNDRYDERKPLLVAAFGGFAADVAALQEVQLAGERQDDLLMAAAPDHRYRAFDARYGKWKDYGLAITVGQGEVLAHERLTLSHNRVAQRVLLALPWRRTLWLANTHLHHLPGEPEVRAAQAAEIVDWLLGAPAADAIVLAGDFNGGPGEPAYAAMAAAGFRSAHVEVHGREPERTWPSGIQAPTMDTDGTPRCVDFVWLRGAVRAVSATVAANEPAPGDPTLYPSDHFAVVTDVDLA